MSAICEKIRNTWDEIEDGIAYLERCVGVSAGDFRFEDAERAELFAVRLITISQQVPKL